MVRVFGIRSYPTKQKTADFVLRFTGGFQGVLDSLPVNLWKPKIKIVAGMIHLRVFV
jgi:hypothetical protein